MRCARCSLEATVETQFNLRDFVAAMFRCFENDIFSMGIYEPNLPKRHNFNALDSLGYAGGAQ